MFRSRLKRCQPLHPSASGNALKKGFVTPRSLHSTPSGQEPKETKETKENKSTSPIEKSSCEKQQSILSLPNNQSQQIQEESSRFCFSVMYYKAGPKKKKTYLDGILYIEKKSYSLFEPSGKLVRKSLETYNPSEFVQGCTITLGIWELEIGSPISQEEYTSGRIFLQSPSTPSPASPKPSLPTKRFTLHMKETPSTQPKVYTGLYKQTDNAFVLQPSFTDSRGNTTAAVILDPSLNTRMKPHQKEGLKFCYNCIQGLSSRGNGCILADEMGLGKTLTAISLIYTCLTQSPYGNPAISSAVVTCPSSLVENWSSEFMSDQPVEITHRKWLGRDKLRCIVINEKGSKAEEKVKTFVLQSEMKRTVLIISYEMFRKYASDINKSKAGLLVCDEGHRLKSSTGNATIDSLRQFPAKRRVILSGTPIQNDMEELYALSEFVNPGVFTSLSSFRQLFVKPIEQGRRKGCTESERELAAMRSAELSRMTEEFILRRTTAVILKTSLPPKITYYLFCSLSEVQKKMYEEIVSLQKQSLVANGSDAGQTTLTFLHILRLLCIHPSLCLESINTNSFLSSLCSLLPSSTEYKDSMKMMSVIALIEGILNSTDELILVISTYTQILDFCAALFESKQWGFFRLDGSTDSSKRQTMVNSFNSRFTSNRLFLLSAKAGGVGLNITGASRVVMMEPAWNPAIDAQSIARAWRFGQTRTVFVYRVFLSGSIEEVMLQRQLLKKDISDVTVDHGRIGEGKLTREEMKELFTLKKTKCATYELIRKKDAKDSVWKEYTKQELKDSIVNETRAYFEYIAEEISTFVEEESKEESFDHLQIEEDELS